MRGTSRKIKKQVDKIEYTDIKKRKRTLETLKPHVQAGYFFYRKNRETDNEIGENRTLFSKSVTSIWKAVGELMLENEGGVFLEEYGYFNGMVLPWENEGTDIGNSKDPYFHTDGYNYCLQFFSLLSRKSCMRGMIMDRTFDIHLKKAFSRALFEDHRPKLYATSLDSMYGYKKTKLK